MPELYSAARFSNTYNDTKKPPAGKAGGFSLLRFLCCCTGTLSAAYFSAAVMMDIT